MNMIMKKTRKFPIIISGLLILINTISALEGNVDVSNPESSEKDKNTQCGQLGGVCKCDCDPETDYGGYGRKGCSLLGCGTLKLFSQECWLWWSVDSF